MYKSRLMWGDIIFLVGFIPTFLLLNGLGTNESSSVLSSVWLFIYSVLLPFMGLGGLMASTAVFRLRSIEKINLSRLNNFFGRILMIVGWLISISLLLVFGLLMYGISLHYTT